MKTKVIGVNTKDKEKNEALKQRQQKLFNDALTLCEKVISIDNKEAFRNDFIGYLKTEFKKQHSGLFPSELITIEKALEQVEFPLFMLSDIQKEYKSIFVPENTDYNIYIEGAAVEIYERLEAVCTSINATKKDRHISFGGIVQAYNGAIIYDFSTQTLTPNINYFLQSLHRA